MKIAVDSFSFYKHFGKHWYVPSEPKDIKWYCKKCVELGVGGFHLDPYHYDLQKDMEWIGVFAEVNDLYVELGACGTTPDELIPYINAASKIGCRVVRTFVGGSCLDGRGETSARAVTARGNLQKVIPYAENADVRIAVENHGDIFIEDMKYILNLDSDCIGMCYDSGNFAFTGEDPVGAIEIFADRIICTHLKDVCPASSIPGEKPFETIGKPVHFCALGEGMLPLDRIFRLLQTSGIDRVTLEICTSVIDGISEKKQLEKEMDAVASSLGYIRNELK